MRYQHHNKETLKGIDRLDISEYVHAFLIELSKRQNTPVKVNTPLEAEIVKGLLNTSKNTTFKSIRNIETGVPYWNYQRVDSVSSNLGSNKGYLFYFICNGCSRRVKYLYQYDLLCSPLCRVCCRIGYKRMPRKQGLEARKYRLLGSERI